MSLLYLHILLHVLRGVYCQSEQQRHACPLVGDTSDNVDTTRVSLFMNLATPVQCTGTITHWNYCFFQDGTDQDIYTARFMMYRESEEAGVYNVVPESIYTLVLEDLGPGDTQGCRSEALAGDRQFPVLPGDILAACVPSNNDTRPLYISRTWDMRAYIFNIGTDCSDADLQVINTNEEPERNDELLLHVTIRPEAPCRMGHNPTRSQAFAGVGTFLNTEYPAECEGVLTAWNYCYYSAGLTNVTYTATVAVWQLNELTDEYTVVEGSETVLTLQYEARSLSTRTYCRVVSLAADRHVTIREGYVVGVVLPPTNAILMMGDNNVNGYMIWRDDTGVSAPSPASISLGSLSSVQRSMHLYVDIVVPTPVPTPVPLEEQLLMEELSTEEKINADEVLAFILNATDTNEALALLETIDDMESILVVLYLLGDIQEESNTTGVDTVQSFLGIGSDLIDREEDVVGENLAIVGASLLDVFDSVAFEAFPDTGNVTTDNIILQVSEVPVDDGIYFTAINSTDFDNSEPEMSVQVPTQLVRVYEESDGRTVSYLYYNVEDFFPPSKDNLTLVSGIVSTALQCGTERCPTDYIELDLPVIISIHHSEEVKDRLLIEKNSTITQCMFWEFLEVDSSEETILSVGQWSDRGCARNDRLSDDAVTVCECNHLTHFAILLSPAPINTSPPVALSLKVIGAVGVGVSLIAMAATIVTFLMLKPLRNMRNFIHINLCISLGIAQIIFVAGVERTGSDDSVPVHCQAIAVLLHYFFLVSFMWMLMEGVVLYIILVKVFISATTGYMLGFFVASYGIPLLYMGLVLPLGFLLPTQPNYGYNHACFLNPSNYFTFSFIMPVIVIILINTGFFIMAAIVTWQHKKKKSSKVSRKEVKNWLKVLFSLMVIMGLTWIVGVLIVEVEALLKLAYIYTIVVAFQGLWIFVLFVVVPKQVRDEYKKWWKARVMKSETLSKHFAEKNTLTMDALGLNPMKTESTKMSDHDNMKSSELN